VVASHPFTVEVGSYVATLPSGEINICEGQGGNVTIPLNTPPVGSTVVWTVSGNTANLLSKSTGLNLVITPQNVSPGLYKVTATVTYQNGGSPCTTYDDVYVRVGRQLSNPQGSNRTICAGNYATIGTPATSGVLYSWTSSPVDPSIGNQRFNSQITVNPSVSTVYTLSYSTGGCTYTESVTVSVSQQPTLETINLYSCSTGSNTISSTNLVNAITSSTAGLTITYWADGNATIPVSSTVSVAGRYFIKAENASGCFTIKEAWVYSVNALVANVSITYNYETYASRIRISVSNSALRYAYSSGTTYTGGQTYENASSFVGDSAIIANQPKGDYTIRIFTANGNCFSDYSVSSTSVICPIEAVPDVYGPYYTGTENTTPSVLVNDTLNGVPVVPSEITLTPGTSPDAGIVMNPDGTITVSEDVVPGTYVYPYSICEIANPDNCVSSTATIVVGDSTIANLSVTKTASSLQPVRGTEITFTIVALNDGSVEASDVIVTDILPSGYTLVSASATTGTWTAPTWTIGTLAVNQSETLTIVATVNQTGNYSNTATISSSLNEEDLDDNTSTVVPSPTCPAGVKCLSAKATRIK
jgi:uncharacterized repeat protein (TIGR01451 family)